MLTTTIRFPCAAMSPAQGRLIRGDRVCLGRESRSRPQQSSRDQCHTSKVKVHRIHSQENGFTPRRTLVGIIDATRISSIFLSILSYNPRRGGIRPLVGWPRCCFDRLGCATTRSDEGQARLTIPLVPSSPRHPKRGIGVAPVGPLWGLPVCQRQGSISPGQLSQPDRPVAEPTRWSPKRLNRGDPVVRTGRTDVGVRSTVMSTPQLTRRP